MPAITKHPIDSATCSAHRTRKRRRPLIFHILAAALAAQTLAGCVTSTPTASSSRSTPNIVALLNGQQITAEDLWPTMAEAAGGLALDEHILSQLLDTAANNRGWTITKTELDQELTALITILDQTNNPESTTRLIDTIRARRGLGPTRFNALLRRNAILRRMIAADPDVAARAKLETKSAIAKLESDATPPSPKAIQAVTRRAKLVAEQSAMEQLARSLVDGAEVLVMDRSVGWSRRGGE